MKTPNRAAPSPKNDRIVLLFDLDCFYAQCERVRLGLSADCSLALLQWNSTLAVTYPAREFGIKRGDSWDDVSQKSNGQCHAIHLHILESTEEGKEDIELEAQDEDIRTAFERIYKLSPEQRTEARKQLGVRRHHNEGKACLERYRLASMRIFSVVLDSLTKHLGGKDKFVLERASIDEFYLDVTNYCHEDGSNHAQSSPPDSSPDIACQKPVVVLGESSIDIAEKNSPLNTALDRACQVSQWIRTDVWNDLGFTMSAGISTNKMMAKLAAGYGKPNGQAVLHPHNFETVMETTKIRKVRNFGGKLGKQVIQKVLNGNEDATMGDLAQVPLPVLLHHFSQGTGLIVFDACRGKDAEDVKETRGALVKSITAFKSFTATSQISEIQKWLNIISNEIVIRVGKDAIRNKRYPKTCTLSYTYYTTPNGKRPKDGTHRSQRITRSARLNYPNESMKMSHKASILKEQAMEKLNSLLSQHPLRGVGMSANNFESKGEPPEGVSSIRNFFPASIDSSTPTTSSSSRFPQQQQNRNKFGMGKYFSKVDTGSFPSDFKDESNSQLKCAAPASFTKSSSSEKSDWELAKELHESFSKESNCDFVSDQSCPKQDGTKEGPLPASATVDDDMVLARKLQARYDREHYVLATASRRPAATCGPAKKKVRRIDTFFQR